jgi:hypothetical protein
MELLNGYALFNNQKLEEEKKRKHQNNFQVIIIRKLFYLHEFKIFL